MFWSTFLLQIFCQLCFSLKDFIKIVRLLLVAVSINGLIQSTGWACDEGSHKTWSACCWGPHGAIWPQGRAWLIYHMKAGYTRTNDVTNGKSISIDTFVVCWRKYQISAEEVRVSNNGEDILSQSGEMPFPKKNLSEIDKRVILRPLGLYAGDCEVFLAFLIRGHEIYLFDHCNKTIHSSEKHVYSDICPCKWWQCSKHTEVFKFIQFIINPFIPGDLLN